MEELSRGHMRVFIKTGMTRCVAVADESCG